MDFEQFSVKINERFNYLATQGRLLHAGISKQQLTEEYLKSFPEGTNPIYLENTVHDCNCCKSFLRQIGNVITVKNGEVLTLWDDFNEYETPYKEVAEHLRGKVLASGIDRVFKPTEQTYGAQITYTVDPEEKNKPASFDHFFCDIPEAYQVSNHDKINSVSNNFTPVLKSLEEIRPTAVDMVLDLIASGSLYRGDEHLKSINAFRQAQIVLDEYEGDVDHFAWENIDNFSLSIRNTVIGSLLKDISEGMDLERAVKRFEDKVAPHNYKRPKALITQGMIDKATATIEGLGLEPSLYRRHARPSDVSVNDILYVDRSVKKDMKDGLLAELKPQKKPKSSVKEGSEISIDQFMSEVLPDTDKLEVLFENKHTGNLMNIFAAVNDDAPPLFKWNNPFSWAYSGGLADSDIRERVSKAGGSVTGEVRISLGWSNADDLDLHLYGPDGHIYYSRRSQGTGRLDVDMNFQRHNAIDPVENITYPLISKMKNGVYKIAVKNYTQRTNSGEGFTLEFEVDGEITTFNYMPQLQRGRMLDCFTFVLKNGEVEITDVSNDLSSDSISKETWGIQTNEYIPVSMMTLSPNHWSGEQGNKHFMFVLKDCINPDQCRGIFNEFLRDDLNEHRKVFEVLGNKSVCEHSEDQLAGLGFSSTKRSSLQVKVDGRPYTVNF